MITSNAREYPEISEITQRVPCEDSARSLAEAAIREGMFPYDSMAAFLERRAMPLERALAKYVTFPTFNSHHPDLILSGFMQILRKDPEYYDVVAGLDAITHGSRLAERLRVPFVNLRETTTLDVKNKEVLYVAEYIGTGKITAKQIARLRRAGAKCEDCVTIFDWELPESERILSGRESFSWYKRKLNPNCNKSAILNPDLIYQVAIEERLYEPEQLARLAKLDAGKQVHLIPTL
jgi:orotate phosphoribosyltransferase